MWAETTFPKLESLSPKRKKEFNLQASCWSHSHPCHTFLNACFFQGFLFNYREFKYSEYIFLIIFTDVHLFLLILFTFLKRYNWGKIGIQYTDRLKGPIWYNWAYVPAYKSITTVKIISIALSKFYYENIWSRKNYFTEFTDVWNIFLWICCNNFLPCTCATFMGRKSLHGQWQVEY